MANDQTPRQREVASRSVWDERFQALLDSSLDAVITMDATGQVLDWNAEAETIFGWSRQEAVGQEMASLIIPAEHRDAQRRGLQTYLATGVSSIVGNRAELTAIHKDGTPIVVELSVAAIDLGHGVFFNAFVRDVTRRRQTLSDLRDSREQLSLLLESTAEAIYGIDLHGKCTFCNPSCVRMLGYESPEELLGRDMHALVHHTRPDGSSYGVTDCPIYQAFQHRDKTHVDDEVFWRKDGKHFPVEYWSYPIERDGEILGAVVTFLDITERRDDAHYRIRMAALVDSSYDAIIGKDMDGKISSWNAGAERVYGYTEEEVIGKSVAVILPPDSKGEEPEIMRAMETGQRLEQFETIRRRHDGTLIPVSVTVSPIADDSGKIIGSSTIERDISDTKRQREELQQAKEDAEEASRARAEFLANVSHELRTPMNAIIGMTQIALGEDLTAEVQDYVQTANDAAHSLLTLLNDILDFSKLESGKFTIDQRPFQLRETIDETVKTLSANAFEKGLELACEVSANARDDLIGDEVRLRQILTNLIGNAIKFTEQGEVVLSVKMLRKWPRETRLLFSVRDTGVGVSATDQRRILKPFTQVDSSSTRRHGGTGLGLAICCELAELMGGELTVESELGKGSCFSFQVTLALQAQSPGTPPEFTPLESLRDMPVLVVDDNATNRRIIGETLATWSMQPATANDAQQALGQLKRAAEAGSPYPLVIVDALMPEMDGYTLSERIVELTNSSPPVILMLSSSDRREFKQREADSAISVYLQKPVSQSDLLDAVMRALNVQVRENGRRESKLKQPVSLAALSILLAEDTPANQKVVAAILKRRGHSVTIAQNGREAVELSRQSAFDAILMDVQMPIMDGFQATAAIRDQERDSDESTPIIAMTAHAMRGDREKCLNAGMDAYIAKPIDVAELMELVESIAAKPTESDAEQTAARDTSVNATSDTSIIDFDGTLKRLAGDMGLFRDFIGFFDEDVPKLLVELRQAITDNDGSTLSRAAHSIKGLAANFGAQACTDAAHELEKCGMSREFANAGDLMHGLEEEVQRLDEELKPYRSG